MNEFPPATIFEVLDSQGERADYYEAYVRAALTLPSVVGIHWFIYSDQPAVGRYDGEDSNFGLVSIEDEPYEELLSRMGLVTAGTLSLRGANRENVH